MLHKTGRLWQDSQKKGQLVRAPTPPPRNEWRSHIVSWGKCIPGQGTASPSRKGLAVPQAFPGGSGQGEEGESRVNGGRGGGEQ